jgi:DNA-binding PadR family transcriptional regulator
MPLTSRSPGALSNQVFQILLSLSDGPRHGYAIIQDIRQRTDDEVRLTASTLYDALARLADQSWIEETDAPEAAEAREPVRHDSRRRYYRLTRLGRQAAIDETARLQRLLEMAREKKLAPGRNRR